MLGVPLQIQNVTNLVDILKTFSIWPILEEEKINDCLSAEMAVSGVVCSESSAASNTHV